MPLNPGQILNNRYRVVRLLGQGGFGAVYRAWDTTLSMPCAVKESFDTTPEGQRQFLREAQILAGLHHANLPRVTDFFTMPEQGQYLVMDYVEGEDLNEKLEKAGGALAEAQVLPWITQVLDALDYLHHQTQPIIHRDIKPANIKITPDNRAVLVDFGIAKTYHPSLKTTLGARAVTPGYSPIEQYGKGITDSRTDLYSLGATLYTLLTGSEPPEAPQRALRDPLVPPMQLNPAISPAVEAALLKVLQMDPAARFQSVTEMRLALTQPLAGGGVSPAGAGGAQAQSGLPAPRRWVIAGGGLLLGILLLAVLARLLIKEPGLTPATQTSQARPSLTVEVRVVDASSTPLPSPIPFSATPTLSPLPPSPPPLTPTTTPAGPFIYTVQEGDTLGTIAAFFNVSISTLLALNPAIDPAAEHLFVGQQIYIPAPEITLPSPTPIPGDIPPGTLITYTVQPGDTLDAIAVYFSSTVDSIITENHLQNANDIYVGQQLLIPVNIATPAPTATPG